MDAKEMFYTIGYEQITKSDSLIIYKHKKPEFECELEVHFWLKDKVIYHNLYVCDKQAPGSSALTIELYQAITQQMKELGWV
jgi:hypothetical protein